MSWLRQNIRIGFTDERGPAWWAADNYMADGSHFDGPVPEDVVRRLLDVQLVEAKLNPTFEFTAADGTVTRNVADAGGRKAIVRVYDNGDGEVLGVFKAGYEIHPYNDWINDFMKSTLDSGLQTAAAALLRKGGVAFHQVKLPEQWEVAGFKFTPYYTGATSADGTVASTWFTGADAAVCDNTYEMARQGAQTRTTRKHTRGSTDSEKRQKIRDQLGLTVKAGEDFAAWVEELVKYDVSDQDFKLWLDEMTPLVNKDGTPKVKNGLTLAEKERDERTRLWVSDPKVKPWAGTAFGILQLDNTWRTWTRTVKGADGGRMERNFINMVKGTDVAEDAAALAALEKVQGRKLVLATS